MIKNNFPNLSTKKIEEDHKVLNKTKKNKPRLKTNHIFDELKQLRKIHGVIQ